MQWVDSKRSELTFLEAGKQDLNDHLRWSSLTETVEASFHWMDGCMKEF